MAKYLSGTDITQVSGGCIEIANGDKGGAGGANVIDFQLDIQHYTLINIAYIYIYIYI